MQTTEAQQPFDLTTGPLWRVTLVNRGGNEFILLLTFHHIIFDGWSLGIFIKELNALYNAEVTDQALNLPPLVIQYADYALWQRRYLTAEVLTQQKAYWMAHLSGAPEQIVLPTDKVRPQNLSYQGGHYTFQLDQATVQQLKRQGAQSGTTLYMTLLAAFKALLYRYCQQEDIVVGSPIANRQHLETAGLIGFFVNTLALRSQHTNTQSFAELLAQVKAITQKAYDNQDIPFELLVEELKVTRSLNRHPLFQVMFVSLAKPATRSRTSAPMAKGRVQAA